MSTHQTSFARPNTTNVALLAESIELVKKVGAVQSVRNTALQADGHLG